MQCVVLEPLRRVCDAGVCELRPCLIVRFKLSWQQGDSIRRVILMSSALQVNVKRTIVSRNDPSDGLVQSE